MNQGQRANKSGKLLEELAGHIASQYGYDYIGYKDYLRHTPHKAIVKGWPYQSIYGHESRGDGAVVVGGTVKVWIEAKRQNVPGSVDEKMPYVMANAARAWVKLAPTVIIIMQGDGFKEGARQWTQLEADKHPNILVMDASSFLNWFYKNESSL